MKIEKLYELYSISVSYGKRTLEFYDRKHGNSVLYRYGENETTKDITLARYFKARNKYHYTIIGGKKYNKPNVKYESEQI